MALLHAQAGEPVSVRPLAELLPEHKTATIIKSAQLEVMRIVLTPGQHMREHRVDGEVTLQCLEGHLALHIGPTVRELAAGDFVLLPRNAPHALHGLTACSALATICLPVKN